MVKPRAGRTSLGCLFTLLLLTVAVYFGVNIGEVFWRAYQFRDAMRTQIRFAATVPDQTIESNLTDFADSLGLPGDARDNLEVERTRDGTIAISSEYDERVELPLFVRTFHFKPHVQGSF
jgi:hypothetical protein